MAGDGKIAEFIRLFQQSLDDQTFIKASLGEYAGEEDLKNLHLREILIKRVRHLSFTYRYKTRDIVKNYDLENWQKPFLDKLKEFRTAMLYTAEADHGLERRGQTYILKKTKATQVKPSDLSHDRVKNRTVEPNRPYLRHLNITDANGTVFKNMQDKYRQIDKYIEILAPLLPDRSGLSIADMGSGKGYLTFALYDYLASKGRAAAVTGVEYRKDMIDLCNRIADECGFSGLSFVQGTIGDYSVEKLDVLIALHACDTATDDAIAKGVRHGAELIVVAPCCHKQIRKEMGKPETLEFLLRFGTFAERQAEMVTDAMRCLILEREGYVTKAFEFISDAHTPKNVMIVGAKGGAPGKAKKQLDDAKAFFGIGEHYLEKALRG